MSTDDLVKHLTDRADYHASRRDHYLEEFKRRTTEQISGEEAMESDEGFATTNNYGGGTTPLMYAKQHRSKASFFKFVAKFLVPNETYRLTEKDLATLELTAGLM